MLYAIDIIIKINLWSDCTLTSKIYNYNLLMMVIGDHDDDVMFSNNNNW